MSHRGIFIETHLSLSLEVTVTSLPTKGRLHGHFTSIHGGLLRLLFNLADKKTSNSFVALGEAFDESEVRFIFR